jgi:hypothetical protein
MLHLASRVSGHTRPYNLTSQLLIRNQTAGMLDKQKFRGQHKVSRFGTVLRPNALTLAGSVLSVRFAKEKFRGGAKHGVTRFAFGCVPTPCARPRRRGRRSRGAVRKVARLAGVDRQLVRHWTMRAGINVTKVRAAHLHETWRTKLEKRSADAPRTNESARSATSPRSEFFGAAGIVRCPDCY